MAGHPIKTFDVRTRNTLLIVTLLVMLLLIATLVLASFLLSISTAARHMLVPEQCEIPLPTNAGTLVYQRVGANALMPEYSRKVWLKSSFASHPLLIDCGNAGYTNVYAINAGGQTFVRLVDEEGEYLLDVKRDELYLVTQAGQQKFVTPLRSERASESVGIPDDDLSRAEGTVDDLVGKRWETIVGRGKETYLGAIFGRIDQLQFHDAVSCPEQKIGSLRAF